MNLKNHLTLLPIVALSLVLGVSIYYFYRSIDSIGKKIQNLDDNYKTLTNRFNDVEQKNRLQELNRNKNSRENEDSNLEESENEEQEQAASDVDGADLEDVILPSEITLDEISGIEEIQEEHLSEQNNNNSIIISNQNVSDDEEGEESLNMDCELQQDEEDENDNDNENENENDNLDEIDMSSVLKESLSDVSDNEPDNNDVDEELEKMKEQNKPKKSLIPPKKLGLARNFKEGHQAQDDNGDTWEVSLTKRGTKRWSRLE